MSSSIRIIVVPPGFAPEAIREQWLGLELPLATEETLRTCPPSNFRTGTENGDGYIVASRDGIAALSAAGKAEAAAFWGDYPGSFYLIFKKEVCEVV